MDSPAPSIARRTAHPPGLKILFFTEMWERFSYYGMRALLVLYLVKSQGYAREDALALYGTYTGLVYLTPVLGGYLADRWLGIRRSAVIGAIIMVAGHFAMAFPDLLKLALGLVVLGNGFFKPNTSTLVGQLYGPGDPRRDGGYTLFYMGINLGAFLAPLVAGTLGENLGWHWGFASAGIGMSLGLAVFLGGQRWLGDAGLAVGRTTLDHRDWWVIGAVAALAPLTVLAALALWQAAGALTASLPSWTRAAIGIIVIALPFLLPRLFGKRADGPALTAAERNAVLAIAVVVSFVVFFWVGFEQAGGTMNLFADGQTDRHLMGFEIPASWFQAINPLLIILLAPFFAPLWTRLDTSRFALPDPAKQGLGMIVLGLGFVVLAFAQGRAETLGKVGPLWLVAVYALHTVGELMLSPVGLAMVSKLAPAQLGGLLMGVWFLSSAAANYLSGILENLLAGSGIPLYHFLVGSSIGAGLALLALTPWLNRLMGGHR